MVICLFCSKTGSTAKYAREFSESVNIPCYSVDESYPSNEQIIFFGWLKGNKVIGLDKVSSSDLAAVCVVGLDGDNRFSKDSIPAFSGVTYPVFYLRGSTDVSKLSFSDRMVFFIVRMKMKLQGLNQFNMPVYNAMKHGGSFYDSSYLEQVVDYCRNELQKDE